jgi:hypothetical protein
MICREVATSQQRSQNISRANRMLSKLRLCRPYPVSGIVVTACYSNMCLPVPLHSLQHLLQVCMFTHPVTGWLSHARLPLTTFKPADDPTRQACWLCHCFFTEKIVTHTDTSLTIANLTSSAAFDSWRPAYSQPHQCSTVQGSCIQHSINTC